MKGKPRPKVNFGPTELARLARISTQLASRKLREGRSVEQIVEEAEDYRRRQALRELPETKVNGFPAYSASLARKEAALAGLREAELGQKVGELVPISYIRQWGVTFLTEARDVLLRGPSELADSLAVENDPQRCEGIVREWAERAMERLYQCERLWKPQGPEAA